VGVGGERLARNAEHSVERLAKRQRAEEAMRGFDEQRQSFGLGDFPRLVQLRV
jgi:hypothetical protein